MNEILDKYEMTIGVECHVQLKTKTKLFSGSDNDARDKSPNEATSPIDFGLPGMLPILNQEAIRLAVRAGKALDAKIENVSRFDRKHYFYPDLPKGYQTSQLYQPIIGEGKISVVLPNGESEIVRIEHAHLEEDAGKLMHYGGYSLVDLNRAGTPLIEIVSMPDIHSAEAARAFAEELHKRMVFADVTEGDLFQGNMRFDVNISARKFGEKELGTRTEVKNLNSFKSVERAAIFEFQRQVNLLEKGEKITQETRGWIDDGQKTVSQRSKEEAQDYRYMPDPDIPPIILTDEMIAELQQNFPKMPNYFRENWCKLGLDTSVTETALNNYSVANFLDEIAISEDKQITKRIFNWFALVSADEFNLISALNKNLITKNRVTELAKMVTENKLSSTGAKEIFFDFFDAEMSEKSPNEIAEDKNLLQVSDENAIGEIVDEVMNDSASAKAVADVRAGNNKAIGFLVGQIMKKSKGKANPELAQKLIRERL